jgi:uncharacterized membrane protein YoaK (UPF0700 family)
MLSGQAYSFRKKARIAVSLSWTSGFTNVYALLVCHVVVSHVTGNVTWFARDATYALADKPDASGNLITFTQVLLFAGLVFSFWIGALLSGFMTELSRRAGRTSIYLFPILAEALLLALFAVLAWRVGWDVSPNDPLTQLLLGSVACMAMGVQNATITIISGSVVRTTHLTGVLTDLGIESAQYILWYRDKTRLRRLDRRMRMVFVSSRHPTIQRLVLLVLIILSFLLGTFMGTVGFVYAKPYAMLLPVALLCWAVFTSLRVQVPQILQVNLSTDNSLAPDWPGTVGFPPGVGVFQVVHAENSSEDQTPHFDRWAERLPESWAVVVLELGPRLRMDEETALDLQAALLKFTQKDIPLLLTNVSPRQLKTLRRYGVVRKLGPRNAIITDPPQALAHAVQILSNR